jgi:hypothetical protein
MAISTQAPAMAERYRWTTVYFASFLLFRHASIWALSIADINLTLPLISARLCPNIIQGANSL